MKRILVVTTSSATRGTTARTVAQLGYRVEFDRDPANAVERVRRRPPAAVMVDINLPPPGCAVFVEACRREGIGADVPILVMAATPRAAIGAIRAGAQGCVKAPVDSATLLPMLSQVHLPTPN